MGLAKQTKVQALIDGIGYGLILCILLGPIFFALLQAGIERGLRAGLMVGLGIWVSDFIFIGTTYFGMAYLVKITAWNGFELYLGLIGGLVLMAFGVGAMVTSPPNIKAQMNASTDSKAKSYLKYWMKGFLVNTINPFTFFFWIGLMTTTVVKNGFSPSSALVFFTGLMGTVILTDSLKVVLAKKIRQKMTRHHVLRMRQVSGLALVIFGIALIARVMW